MDTPNTPDRSPARVILIPGFWLGAWAWDAVVAELQRLGVAAQPLEHPGVGADPDADLESLLAPLLAIVGDGPPPVLVVHSGAGAYASLITDRVPDAVAHVVYVDSGPVADGQRPHTEGVDARGILPPTLSDLEAMGPMVADLTPEQVRDFAQRALPVPIAAADPAQLHDERRHQVPSTLICCSFDSATVQSMVEAQVPMFAATADLHQPSFVDLPTGHWPMWSRPTDLAAEIADVAENASAPD
ncbi:alpha/beta fold hydrolase [Dermacoccaceae bacterium W4C1]